VWHNPGTRYLFKIAESAFVAKQHNEMTFPRFPRCRPSKPIRSSNYRFNVDRYRISSSPSNNDIHGSYCQVSDLRRDRGGKVLTSHEILRPDLFVHEPWWSHKKVQKNTDGSYFVGFTEVKLSWNENSMTLRLLSDNNLTGGLAYSCRFTHQVGDKRRAGASQMEFTDSGWGTCGVRILRDCETTKAPRLILAVLSQPESHLVSRAAVTNPQFVLIHDVD
jgi:hypothetical protein